MFAFALLYACAHPPADDSSASADTDTDTDSDTDSDSDTDTDSGIDTGAITLPTSPLPITLTLTGAASETATFDTVVCSHPPNNQLQLTWTDSANTYTWHLRVFVREPFTGDGTYSTTVETELIEDFSGGRYFSATTPDTAMALTVDGFGANGAYGSLTTGALSGDAGSVTLAPQPIPFWCDVVAQ